MHTFFHFLSIILDKNEVDHIMGMSLSTKNYELNVDLELGQSEGVTVSVYNLIGELIVTKSYEMSKGINTIQLDIDGLKDGVYLCKVNSGNNQMTRKFNVLK